MKQALLQYLCCPTCKKDLRCKIDKEDNLDIIEGQLTCVNGCQVYPIINGIPRFVPMENYAHSFGFQWNTYKRTQVDQYSMTQQSKNRFLNETGWDLETLAGEWILELGCGNGRFIDIASKSKANVIGVDLSSAIDAAGELFKDRPNVHLVQASVYALPFKNATLDKCYSIGVIQHTPNPSKSIEALTELLKPNGELALTIYERKPWTKLYSKYWFRPLTKRMSPKRLLKTIKILSPVMFPVTEVLFRIPVAKRLFQFVIPYANYVEKKELSLRQRYEWAILDTFDMLSPAYDLPMTEDEVKQVLNAKTMKNIKRLHNPGLNFVAQK